MMEKYQENIIPALNQNKVNVFEKEGNDGLKILFVGNSITRHAPKPEVGWLNDCGMAASSIERDYVHLLMDRVHAVDKDASFQIAQVAGFEWNFLKQLPDEFAAWQKSADYAADIIIMFFGLAATVRRLHDTGKSALWVYISYALGCMVQIFTATSTTMNKLVDEVTSGHFTGRAIEEIMENGSDELFSLSAISIVSGIVALIVIFMCLLDSSPYANKYGESPKYVEE